MANDDSDETWIRELKAHVANHPIFILNLEERELHGRGRPVTGCASSR